MRSFGVLLQLVLWSALALVGHIAAIAGQAQEKVVTLRDIMVPMRDGVRLATDVYLPAEAAQASGAVKLP